MADLDLRVDYQDDILDSSVNTKRKYNIIENEDGTKSLEDVSVYTQNGDSFGAADINKTNQAVLDLNSSLTTKVDKSVNGVVIFKNGKNIELRVNTTKELTPNSWTPILIIPQDYTPSAESLVRTVCWNTTSDIALPITVDNKGSVKVYSKTSGNINIYADISYIQ